MIKIPDSEISQLEIFGLKGRLLRLKSKSPKHKQKIVLLSGLHTRHERMYGVADFLSRYGEVYAPDLPGFGGMDSFFSVNRQASADDYAEYIKDFLEKYDLTSGVTIIPNSVASQFFIRMLHNYPETRTWFKKSVGLMAFADDNNFNIPWVKQTGIDILVGAGRHKLGANLLSRTLLSKSFLEFVMKGLVLLRPKMKVGDKQRRREAIEMEVLLWTENDKRTHGVTAYDMFRRRCSDWFTEPMDMTFYNIATKKDQYFDHQKVTGSMRKIFSDYQDVWIKADLHSPSVIGTADDFAGIIPDEAIKILTN